MLDVANRYRKGETMLGNLSGPQRAAGFYMVAFALALLVVSLSGTFGEASPIVTMLTPAIAVLVMMLVLTDEGRSRAGWQSLGLTHAGFRGWWLAILGPVAILVACYAILVALGMAQLIAPELSRSAGATVFNMALSLVIGLVFAFTEEIGWRGYMLPKLVSFGIVPAMLIVGFFHGVWHLPLMIFTPYYHAGANLIFLVPLFLVTLTLAGIFYGWLRIWTGSVWPVAIAHAVYNFIWGLGSEFVTAPAPGTMEYIGGESGILVIVALLVFALIVVPRIRRMEKGPAALAPA
jgi:membrane protease YdiL (CAAX protease family)